MAVGVDQLPGIATDRVGGVARRIARAHGPVLAAACVEGLAVAAVAAVLGAVVAGSRLAVALVAPAAVRRRRAGARAEREARARAGPGGHAAEHAVAADRAQAAAARPGAPVAAGFLEAAVV